MKSMKNRGKRNGVFVGDGMVKKSIQLLVLLVLLGNAEGWGGFQVVREVKKVADDIGDEIGDVANDIGDEIGDVAKSALELAVEAAQEISEKTKEAAMVLAEEIKDEALDMTKAATETFDAAVDAVPPPSLANGAINLAANAAGSLGVDLDKFEGFLQQGMSLASDIVNEVEAATGAIGREIEDAADEVGDAIGEATEFVDNKIEAAIDAANDFIDDLIDCVQFPLLCVPEIKQVKDYAEDKAGDISNAIKDIAISTADAAADIGELAMEFFQDLANSAFRPGCDKFKIPDVGKIFDIWNKIPGLPDTDIPSVTFCKPSPDWLNNDKLTQIGDRLREMTFGYADALNRAVGLADKFCIKLAITEIFDPTMYNYAPRLQFVACWSQKTDEDGQEWFTSTYQLSLVPLRFELGADKKTKMSLDLVPFTTGSITLHDGASSATVDGFVKYGLSAGVTSCWHFFCLKPSLGVSGTTMLSDAIDGAIEKPKATFGFKSGINLIDFDISEGGFKHIIYYMPKFEPMPKNIKLSFMEIGLQVKEKVPINRRLEPLVYDDASLSFPSISFPQVFGTMNFLPDKQDIPIIVKMQEVRPEGPVCLEAAKAASADSIQFATCDGTLSQKWYVRNGKLASAMYPGSCLTASLISNVALGKPTSQSSTDHGGVSSKAVDGNTNGHFFSGSVTHTFAEDDAWFEVDLEDDFILHKVKLYNRDVGQERLNNPVITLLDSSGATVLEKQLSGYSPIMVFDFALTGPISKVKVQLLGSNRILSLAEVEVFGFLFAADESLVAADESQYPHLTVQDCVTDASFASHQQWRVSSDGFLMVDAYPSVCATPRESMKGPRMDSCDEYRDDQKFYWQTENFMLSLPKNSRVLGVDDGECLQYDSNDTKNHKIFQSMCYGPQTDDLQLQFYLSQSGMIRESFSGRALERRDDTNQAVFYNPSSSARQRFIFNERSQVQQQGEDYCLTWDAGRPDRLWFAKCRPVNRRLLGSVPQQIENRRHGNGICLKLINGIVHLYKCEESDLKWSFAGGKLKAVEEDICLWTDDFETLTTKPCNETDSSYYWSYNPVAFSITVTHNSTGDKLCLDSGFQQCSSGHNGLGNNAVELNFCEDGDPFQQFGGRNTITTSSYAEELFFTTIPNKIYNRALGSLHTLHWDGSESPGGVTMSSFVDSEEELDDESRYWTMNSKGQIRSEKDLTICLAATNEDPLSLTLMVGCTDNDPSQIWTYNPQGGQVSIDVDGYKSTRCLVAIEDGGKGLVTDECNANDPRMVFGSWAKPMTVHQMSPPSKVRSKKLNGVHNTFKPWCLVDRYGYTDCGSAVCGSAVGDSHCATDWFDNHRYNWNLLPDGRLINGYTGRCADLERSGSLWDTTPPMYFYKLVTNECDESKQSQYWTYNSTTTQLTQMVEEMDGEKRMRCLDIGGYVLDQYTRELYMHYDCDREYDHPYLEFVEFLL